MSTTSTTYSKHRKRRIRTRANEEGRGRNDVSTDLIIKGDREPITENGKWSSDKLKHELSSFIAQFSYLTDTSNKTQTEDLLLKKQVNAPARQNVQVFAARREQMNSPFDDTALKRRGVGWEDGNRGTAVYSVQGASCDVPTRDRGFRQEIVRRPRLRVRKSRSARRTTTRNISCPQRTRSVRNVRRQFSSFRASKSRSRKLRPRSCRSETPVRRSVRSRLRRRSRSEPCERSAVKYMPFRFRGKRTREIVVKKSKPKLTYKNIEPFSEPTLVTLFPRTNKRKPLRSQSREPELPCKCKMCTNKYESLARLYHEPQYNHCNPTHPPICAPCLPACNPFPPLCGPCPTKCSPCPPKCHIMTSDQNPCPPKCQTFTRHHSPCTPIWDCSTGNAACSRPWADQYRRNDACQPVASRCVKRVCFKFGATNQCLNSYITHYFHSILDRRLCC